VTTSVLGRRDAQLMLLDKHGDASCCRDNQAYAREVVTRRMCDDGCGGVRAGYQGQPEWQGMLHPLQTIATAIVSLGVRVGHCTTGIVGHTHGSARTRV
jgi:hypothetical protein